MIVTLTANPSLDRTLEIPGLARGSVIRAVGSRTEPGGKGVNISRVLAANGHRTLAVLPSGGGVGARLTELLAPQGVEVVEVPVAGGVRVNISAVEPDGTVTKINAPGPRLTPAEAETLAVAACAAATGASWLVLAGSLPPGLPDTFYAHLVVRLRGVGPVRIAVDSSGPPLAAVLSSGPDLVKPNRAELAEAAGRPVTTLGEALSAARLLLRRGAHSVLASLGADGALLVGADGTFFGEALVGEPRSTVGAGDALLAGYLAAGTPGPDALAEALAWGAAAVALPGSRMPGRADVDRSSVRLYRRIDPDRPLTERT